MLARPRKAFKVYPFYCGRCHQGFTEVLAGCCPVCGCAIDGRPHRTAAAAVREASVRETAKARYAAVSHAAARERTAVRESSGPSWDGRPRWLRKLYGRWLADEPGNPLGRGMPPGATLRLDGESHSNAWRRLLRADPCSYCGEPVSGTVDHVEPRSRRKRDTERWVNLVGACSACNRSKSSTPLLLFLLTRATDGCYTVRATDQ